MMITRIKSTITKMRAPPIEPPIMKAETGEDVSWKEVAPGVEVFGVATELEVCKQITPTSSRCEQCL